MNQAFPAPDAEAGFDPVVAARRVLRTALTGALATADADGHPFASLVTVAADIAGAPILLLSGLALHTRNIARDGRVSLLLVAPGGEGGDPLAGARLTVSGTIGAPDADPALGARFLARHPEAAGYAGFADFGFYRMEVAGAHLVAGFGRIVALEPGRLLTDLAGAEALAASEAGAVAHMNEDHLDAIALYATRLCGAPGGDWRATGADPLGLDMRAGALTARLDFPARVTDGGGLRRALVDLAKAARDRRAV